jgi:acyl-CoA thioester hydrolase
MPSIHTKTFKTRSYECDPFGDLKPVNYLRWMQEAAFEASAKVGYDFSSYNQMGQWWLVRETEIQFHKPLHYKDEVEIKTWVMDFRNFRSKRAYKFRRKDTNHLVATATTDWVYLDAESHKPVMIPDDMKSAFFPEGVPSDSPRRRRFPKVTPHSEILFGYRRVVSGNDIDRMWHVNNAAYLDYLDESNATWLTDLGWSPGRMLAEGIRTDIRSIQIEYLQPAKHGDALEISTWHSDILKESVRCHQNIYRVTDNKLLIRAHSSWGFRDVETAEPHHIPATILKAISN